MTEDDITAVQYIARETWKDTYTELLPGAVQENYLDNAYAAPMLVKRMEKTDILVAEKDGRPVGFLNLTTVDQDGDSELTALYVLPEYQRMGTGAALFQSALDLLEKASRLYVYVDDLNDPAKAFFKQLGFELLTVFEEEFEGVPVETAEYVYAVQQRSPVCV